MGNIVDSKEFRVEFRKNIEAICDFSQRKSRHILGIGARQVNMNVAVDVIEAMKSSYESAGRTLDKTLIDLHTPKGMRLYASQQLSQMSKINLAFGANAIETLWKTFGVLIPVARRGRRNVYVAKNGATAMEWASASSLSHGKAKAMADRDRRIGEIIREASEVIADRPTGEVYAETCTEYFKTIPSDTAAGS